MDRQHNVEKIVNDDGQFVVERIYDLITQAKKVDISNSVFGQADGKLTLIMQDDTQVVIQHNSEDASVTLLESGLVSNLSSLNSQVASLYFDRITDEVKDPEIALGVNFRLNIKGQEEEGDVIQNYVTSANLERGDYDGDNCPDFIDYFPRHDECCGDADDDGSCDEMDNCILDYNPFQGDYDNDGIGDECDDAIFDEDNEGGDDTGGLAAYNCSDEDQIIDLLNQHPPLSTSQLKQVLVSSSPLPPNVLSTVIDMQQNDNLMGQRHFRDVMVINTKLPDDVYDDFLSMTHLSWRHKFTIIAAQIISTYIPWLGVDTDNEITYDYTITDNSIIFYNPSSMLGADDRMKTDIFAITLSELATTVNIEVETTGQDDSNSIAAAAGELVELEGFMISLSDIANNNYFFTVNSLENDEALESVTFTFDEGISITSPNSSSYDTRRYIYYCPGGCNENCGDVGTGVMSGHFITDRCYNADNTFPEWCSRWRTYIDADYVNSAYVGSTQPGENEVYWEKSFKSILSDSQIDALESFTLTAEIAYQSITQFFCDQFGASCPIDGTLMGTQNMQLYNYNTDTWETVGQLGTDGGISDQQEIEITYSDEDLGRFIDPTDNHTSRARMEFHWNGIDAGNDNAPSFMMIDYFTLHLKW